MSRPHLILKSTHTETCSRARSKGWTITDFEHEIYLLLLASTKPILQPLHKTHTIINGYILARSVQRVDKAELVNCIPPTTLSRHVHLPVDFKSPPRVAKLVGFISTIKKSSYNPRATFDSDCMSLYLHECVSMGVKVIS